MNKKRKYALIVIIGIIFYSLLSVAFYSIEKQSTDLAFTTVFDAIWYSVAAFFAIGYGDISILSIWGRIIGITFILLGICFLGLIIGNITNIITKKIEKRRVGHMGTSFENHIIILGWDSFSADVATQLVKADYKVAIITQKKDDIDLIYQCFSSKDVFACFADIKNYEALKLVNASNAKVIYLNNGGDSDKLISIINIRKLYHGIEFVVILDNSDLKETFVSAGVTYVLSKNEIASKMLASYIFEPAVADFTQDLIASTDSETEYDIQQYRICDENPFINAKYGDMFNELKQKYNIISIGLHKTSNDSTLLIKVPLDNEVVEKGDDVIVIANGITEKIMKNLFKVNEGI